MNSLSSGKRGFVLTPADVEILRLIFEHRFLRREHVSDLTGRHPKRLHRRLSKLEHHGYLSTIRLPQQKYIYGLAKEGIGALVEYGLADAGLLDSRLRTHELKELFLRHEMMIADIHVRLSVASKDGPVKLASWREGGILHDSVVVPDKQGRKRLPVRPDAFFTLLDSRRPEGANRSNFALEADRSTETLSRFRDKVRAYWAYMEQRRCVHRLGVRSFRVISVTLTSARAENLSLMTASALPHGASKYFLFAPLTPKAGGAELASLLMPPGNDLITPIA